VSLSPEEAVLRVLDRVRRRHRLEGSGLRGARVVQDGVEAVLLALMPSWGREEVDAFLRELVGRGVIYMMISPVVGGVIFYPRERPRGGDARAARLGRG